MAAQVEIKYVQGGSTHCITCKLKIPYESTGCRLLRASCSLRRLALKTSMKSRTYEDQGELRGDHPKLVCNAMSQMVPGIASTIGFVKYKKDLEAKGIFLYEDELYLRQYLASGNWEAARNLIKEATLRTAK